MIDNYYKKGCKEVIEILSYIPKEDYDKIPKEIIKVLENDKDEDYNFKYNPNKTLDEQNVSKQAKTIIAILFRDYWSSEHQRKIIKEYENDLYKKIENEKKKKYNSNKIFETERQTKIKNIDRASNNVELVEYKESIFKKFIDKLKKIFHIN